MCILSVGEILSGINIDELKNKKIINGLSTGYQDLDGLIGGLKQDDLALIASRPSVGKTALALNIAYNLGFQNKKGVIFFSLDACTQQIVQKLLCIATGIELQKCTFGELTSNEWKKIENSIDYFKDAKLFIDDSVNITTVHIKETCTKLTARGEDIGLIIIDYLELLNDGEKLSELNSQIELIMKNLKKLARELKVPIIVLSKVSAKVDLREDKHPLLSDLAEPSSIGTYANLIMFLYREDYYNLENEEKRGIAEIIVAKNSHGNTGVANLKFDRKTGKFKDVEY